MPKVISSTDLRNGYLIEESARDMARCVREACRDLSRVRQVGQNAMDEIYISWESAVRSAVDRYGEVIELHKGCSMTERKYQPSDHFLSMAAGLVETSDKVFHAPRRLYEGMLENVNDLRENIAGQLQETKENIAGQLQGTRENIAGQLQETKENIAERFHGTRENVKEWVREVKGSLGRGELGEEDEPDEEDIEVTELDDEETQITRKTTKEGGKGE